MNLREYVFIIPYGESSSRFILRKCFYIEGVWVGSLKDWRFYDIKTREWNGGTSDTEIQSYLKYNNARFPKNEEEVLLAMLTGRLGKLKILPGTYDNES